MGTPADVRALFEERLKEGIPIPPGEFNQVDLDRLKDDKYLNRALKHQEYDAKRAADMLWDIMVWRKNVGASDLNESTIRLDYLKDGAFFPHGRDVDGHLLLIMKSKLHIKGQKDIDELKKCVIYWFDRIEREENGKPITLFFDMEGCGLGNVDMELIKYLIQLMKYYYPAFLHYIIIYQMPWVLSAAFKVIKGLLPPRAVELMKFLNKDNLDELIPPESTLVCWGGTDEYVFEFVPENKQENTTKKVTFADDDQHSPGEMLRIVPNETIIFKSENDELTGQFVLTNMDEGAISFKIRTTSPEKFRVKPSLGVLAKGAVQKVVIVVQQGSQVRTVARDRFLVLSVQIPKTNLSSEELAEIWKKSSGSKVDEYRLKCSFPEKELPKNGDIVDSKITEKPDNVVKTLNRLEKNYELLNRNVKTLTIFQFLTVVLTFVTVFLSYVTYSNSYSESRYCEKM